MSGNKDDAKRKNVPDQGGVGFTADDADDSVQGNIQGAGQVNQQQGDPGQDAGKSNGGAWRPDVPDQSGVGFLPEDAAGGNRQGGSVDSQQSGSQQGNQQGGQQGGHQASSGIQSNFAHASPESMVNPPGAPQSGAGSIAGKQADEIPGGVASQIQASRNQQSGQGVDAAGGVPGTPADDGRYGVNSSEGAGMERGDS